jgi:hypothetical protein
MAIKIATENGLVTLRVRVRPRERGVAAELQLVSYLDGKKRELDVWYLDADQGGLPRRLEPRSWPFVSLAPALIEELKNAIEDLGLAPGIPLWLHLVKPYGFLGALDWEGGLAPIQRPVVRLPDFLERPREDRETLNVALVCSEPVSEPRLDPPRVLHDIVEAVLAGSRRQRTMIHVFPDQSHHATLSGLFAGESRVAVHDPAEASDYGEATRTGIRSDAIGEVRNPWLKWMRDSMRGDALDAVHFVCHGFVGDQKPAIALAESPLSNRDRTDARYVDVRELAAFLTQVGAWSAVFSSPPGNYSEAGLRLLADTLAQARPGPVLYHNFGAFGLDPVLQSMYGFLYAPVPSPLPSQERWFAYCQPSLIARMTPTPLTIKFGADAAVNANNMLFRIGLEAPVAGSFDARHAGASTPPGATPSWISSAQRYVETQSLQLQRDLTRPSSDKAANLVSVEVERTLAKLQSIVGSIAKGEPL